MSRSIFIFHTVLFFPVLCVRCAKRSEEEGERTEAKDSVSSKSAGAIDEGITASLAGRQRSVQGKHAPVLPSLTNHRGGGNEGRYRRLWFYPVLLLFASPKGSDSRGPQSLLGPSNWRIFYSQHRSPLRR